MSSMILQSSSATTFGLVLPVAVVGIAAVAAICILAMVQRSRERGRRLELIEAALRNPSLPAETQRQLIQALQPKPVRWPFALGWLGVFAGIGMLFLGLEGLPLWAVVNLTALSFGLITLPLALREVEARRS